MEGACGRSRRSRRYALVRSFRTRVLFVTATLKNDDAEDSDDEGEDNNEATIKESKALSSENAHRTADKQPTGRIVGVIKRNWRAYVCHIDSTSLTSSNATSLSQQTVFATPVSRLLPRIRLRTRQAPTLVGQKILVTIDKWDATSRYPEGHFVRALGRVESKEAEQESLLLEFEVPYRPFGKAILDCLPAEGTQWVVPPKSSSDPAWRDREDLRGLIICSIDPPSEWAPVIECAWNLTLGRYRLSGYRRRTARSRFAQW